MADGVLIDTDGVGDFGKGLRTEADTGMTSAADRAKDLHAHGVQFGASISHGPIAQARELYVAALTHTEANMRVYPQAAAVLAEVAEQIAREFAGADWNSAATQQRIDAVVNGAITRSLAAQQGQQNIAINTYGPFAKEGQA